MHYQQQQQTTFGRKDMSKNDEEREESEKRTNVYAAIGVGIVCVLIGLPLWWKTTQVYRVSLPYSDIQTLVNTKVQYSVEVTVISFVEQFKGDDLTFLSKTLMDTFAGSPDSIVHAGYKASVREATPDEQKAVQASTNIKEVEKTLSTFLPRIINNYYVLILPGDSRLVTKPTLGLHQALYIPYTDQGIPSLASDISSIVKTTVVREQTIIKGLKALKAERSKRPDKEMLRSVRSHPGYDIILTLINPQPNIIDADWDVENAVQDYLSPFLTRMTPYTELSVKSQVLYYTKVATKPRKASDGFFFTPQDLPHIINPLESKLGSPASTNPELNFLIYVPTKDQYPLYIKNDNGVRVENNAFLSPQWGGICIYNIAPPPDNATLPHLATVDLRQVMGVILTQLRLLLNLQAETSEGVHVVPVGNRAIADWELDSWLRSRTVENLATSVATLDSLSSLLGKISNIVINDDIGKQVETAVSSIHKSHQLLAAGRLEEAFIHSRTASIASEKAFFDPSLLELLYFPEDQKFAIYIPLFLPISFPVISSLWNAFSWYRGTQKPKQD